MPDLQALYFFSPSETVQEVRPIECSLVIVYSPDILLVLFIMILIQSHSIQITEGIYAGCSDNLDISIF